MKHLYKLLFAFLLLSHFAQAQMNLVPNPSFEDSVQCPNGAGQVPHSDGWYSAKGSPDYYHTCSNQIGPYFGIPTNVAGFQTAYDGEAYIGLATYTTDFPNIRECVGIKLAQPLSIGNNYFVSAYISWAGEVFWGEPLDCKTNKLGFKFSTNKFDATISSPVPTDNFAHVYSDDIITDSINWVQVSGSFIADSAYSYLLIGNFFDDTSTDKGSCIGTAYYYIDNVCVSTDSLVCQVISSAPAIQTRSSIKLYPNPATDVLTISNVKRSTAYIIFAGNGQVRQKGRLPETNAQISLAGLPPGLYFLQLAEVGTFKFVVSR